VGDIRKRADTQAATAVAKGPTGEQRSSIIPELAGVNLGIPGWSHFMPPERELTPAWIGRQRTETVQSMINDTQVTALRQAVRLPAHRYRIALDPAGADADDCDLLAADLDVPLLNGPDEARPGRRADRFSSRRHLDRVLDALDYGHAVFEHAGRIDENGLWRLTDLAPVPPWTIDDPNSWEVDRRGRLVQVVQRHTSPAIELPVEQLCVFTWQGAPGDPRGRPMLRPLYGPWLLRDRTLRVLAMSGERTGMGIPVGKVTPGSGPGVKLALERLLGGLAAGVDTNLVIESEDKISDAIMLMGVTGSTPDLVGHLRYHDECMARATLAMLLELNQGGKGGSYALGDTFNDLLAMFHDTVVDWYCDVMTVQLCEPWFTRNRGPEVPAARLAWARDGDDADEADDAEPDDAEDPAINSTAEELTPPQLPAPATARRRARAGAGLARRQQVAHAAFTTIAGRELRRLPTDAELRATTDFAQLEAQHVATRDELTTELLRARDDLAGVAIDEIATMRSVDPLTLGATLEPMLAEHAAGMHTGVLVSLLTAAADAGCAQVIAEAARQGVQLAASVDYEPRAEVEAREMVRRMAAQVTESAAAAARTRVATSAGRGLLARALARLGAGEADVVAVHLASLTAAQARGTAAGAASRATFTGRSAALEQGNPDQVYASEILDEATCGPCQEIDGTNYASMEEARADYPGGGFIGCDGMERCRGTLVATWGDEV
jgi:hypothetical protein